MRRLFVIIPAALLLLTFGYIIGASSVTGRVTILEDRVRILEHHLDSTGE